MRATIDGSKRPRRNGQRGAARKAWYARHRAARFAKRFGACSVELLYAGFLVAALGYALMIRLSLFSLDLAVQALGGR